MVVNRKITAGYLGQVERANESPEALKRRLEDANALIDSLRAQVKQLRAQVDNQRHLLTDQHGDEPDVQKVLQVSGRPIGNQSALARALNIGADRVSKWHAQGRLQCYTDAAGLEWFYLDQSRPSRKKRGL